MKRRLSIFFAFALITSMASIGAAVESMDHKTFKADLSGAEVPPVPTMATGEAIFNLVGPGMMMPGHAPGGSGPSADRGGIPGDDTGMAGPGQGPGQPGVGPTETEPYSGFTDKDKGNVPGAGAGGTMSESGLHYQLNVKDLENPKAAHLHLGKSTTSEGPVVAPLFLGPAKSGKFSGMLAEGTITDKDLTGPLSGKSVNDLIAMIESGDVYVNIHTAKHPTGEIRGQVKDTSKG